MGLYSQPQLRQSFHAYHPADLCLGLVWAKTASTPRLLITLWKFPQKGSTIKTEERSSSEEGSSCCIRHSWLRAEPPSSALVTQAHRSVPLYSFPTQECHDQLLAAASTYSFSHLHISGKPSQSMNIYCGQTSEGG